MPFTLVHPAAIVPLHRALRGATSLTALTIGSLIPDLPMFLDFGVARSDTHSSAGIVLLSLPLGLVAYLLWEVVLRAPLTALLPHPLADRLHGDSSNAQRVRSVRIAMVAVCLVAGAATHALWDAFTHRHGVFVERIPALQSLLFQVGGYKVWSYKLAQHGSTVLAGTLLTFWCAQWYRRAQPSPDPTPGQPSPRCRVMLWSVFLLVPLVTTFLAGTPPIDGSGWLKQLQSQAAIAVFSGGRWLLLALLVYSMGWQIWRWRGATRRPSR